MSTKYRQNHRKNPQHLIAALLAVLIKSYFTVLLLALAFSTNSARGNQALSWGRNLYSQAAIPSGLTNPVAVGAGFQHCLGLNSDGSLIAWGAGTNGQNTVPLWISNNVIAIKVGYYHNLVQLNDGSLAAWGAGQTNAGAGFDYGQSIIPPNLTNVISFAAGGYFNLALLSDHIVVAWGRNTYGETNLPAGMTNIAAIAAAGLHSLALRGDGTVAAWGGNGAGESSVPAGLTNVVGIFAGDYNSYAIRSDGSIVVWGDNTAGQSTVPAGVSNVVLATGGAYHSAAIEDSGYPVAWGQYDSALPAGVTNAFTMHSGFYMGLMVTNDGSPVITFQPPSRWIFSGNNTAMRALVAGLPPISYQWLSNSVPIPDATNALLSFPVVQTNQAATYSFVASNSLGVVVSSNAVLTVIEQPPIITTQPSSVVTYRFGPATLTSAAVGSPPLYYQWQLNGTNLPNATNAVLSYTALPPSLAGVYSVTVSNQFGSITSTNASLTALPIVDTGDSSYTYNHYSVPLSLTNVVAVAAGAYHGMALKPDGSVVVWGNNQYGQTNVPAAVTNIMAIAARGYTCAAVRSNGTVVMWGDSYFVGLNNAKTNPPANATNAVVVAIGDNHCMVLRKDGTVVAWGNNTYGQTNIPASATNIMAVAVGAYHSLLLRSNGTLIAWGYNNYGQTNLPAAYGLTNVVAIDAAGYNNIAVKADGTAYFWGQSSGGYVGSIKYVRAAMGTSPVVLRSTGLAEGPGFSSISNAIAIAANSGHNIALIGDGTPFAYGPPVPVSPGHAGDTITTRIFVSGSGPIFYQWLLNGTIIPDSTNSILTLTNVPITSAGSYVCIISNAQNSVTSAPVTLNLARWPLLFTSTNGVTQMTTNGFKFRLTGLAGQGSLIVYASTNLLDWSPIFTNPPSVGTLDFLDPSATNLPSLYYRASENP